MNVLMQVTLQHAPQRHGLMLAPGHPTKKYDERPGAITPGMLSRHLAGQITLAAPAAANGLAALLPIDVDAGGLVAIYALLDAAQARGLWAWAEYHPRDGLDDDLQRGYVWLGFDRLLPATQLQALGKQLIAEADLDDAIRTKLDCRAQNAVTRLPFARHTHTGRFGLLFIDELVIDLNLDMEGGLAQWAAAYQANSAPQLPESAPPPIRTTTAHSQPLCRYSPAVLKERWNAACDVCEILLRQGGKRHSRTLYHCPCGHHANGDARPSLLIRPSTKAAYGASIVQGYAPTCRFFSDQGQVWDAFNVYMVLHGLTYAQMLTHVRRELGLYDTPERPRNVEITTSQHSHQASERRRAQHQTPFLPPEDPATTQALRQALLAWLITAVISPTARKILTYLIGQAEHHQASWCKRTVSTIAQATSCAPRTVQTAIRHLQATGALEVIATADQWGGDQANIYRLTPLPQSTMASMLPTSHLGHDHPLIVAQDTAKPGGGGDQIDHPCILRLVRGGNPQPAAVEELPARDDLASGPPSELEACMSTGPAASDDQGVGAMFTSVPEGMSMQDDGTFAPRGEPGDWELDWSPKDEHIRQQVRARKLAPPADGALPPAPPARRDSLLQQTSMPLRPRPGTRLQLGTQALQAEVDRLEREARRCFAIGAPSAGRRYRVEARQVREQLARVEQHSLGGSAPPRVTPPLQAPKARKRGRQTVLEVPYGCDS